MVERVYSADELEVCEEVGRGGFGIVYRGVISKTNQEVAIKQIDLENDQTDLLEINKEIQIISECRLPQITKYLGCFTKNYKLWVIMEFVDGGSLYDLLKPGPITDESIISIILKEILLALEYLHNQGKIHRDLKSQNILINKKSDIKLTDFGVSTQLSSNFSRRNTTVGTPYWMAPEVILNNNGGHGFKADIWSLGCCAYEILTGKPPLQLQYTPMKALRQISQVVSNNDFLKLIDFNELEISSSFKDFLLKCFEVDPKLRFSATKLLNHKFITKVSKTPDRVKNIRQLITKKQLWDQENYLDSNKKNYYVPTEIVKNQKKWQNEENENDEDKTFNFDISSIQYSPSPRLLTPKISPPPSTNTNSDQSILSIKQDQIVQNLRPEFHRILTKVFHKIESRNTLTTEQYDLLVTLNDVLLNLFSFTSNLSNLNYQKIVVFQYLKYFLKELTKDNGGVNTQKNSLQKLIIPSNLQQNNNNHAGSNNTNNNANGNNQFDEIEKSLLEYWIDRMGERRN